MLRLISFFFLFSFSMGAYAQKWLQLGADIDGSGDHSEGDYSGYSVDLSNDGTIVVIGAPLDRAGRNVSMSTQPGTVTAYQFINNAWVQLGQKIVGNNGEQIGNVVSISGDGSIVAFGHNRGDNRSVRIFKYSGGSWSQLGDDINRENEYDEHGSDISLSDDGTIVAIGAAGNDGAGNRSGHVRVHQWDGSAWVQRGSDLDGEASGDNSGHSVSLSSDGTIVAIGAYGNYGGATAAGHVRVYQWDGSTWVQLGDDIDGERVEDRSGYSVSLSDNGTILAVGSKDADKQENSPTNNGHVRVFQYSSGSWTQLGDDIDGEAPSDYFGTSVSLSGDGTIFSASAPGNDDKDSDAGHVRAFKWNGSSWAKLGDNINGEAPNDNSGGSEHNAISISNDGTKIAIGARLNDGAGNNAGHTRIYQYRDPNVTLSSPSYLPEVAGATATVTATLEFASSIDVQVTLASTGTATGGGTDYTLSSNTITIAAGQTTGTATLTAVADQVSDDGETIILDIASAVNAIEATEQKVTITISEDICTDSGGSNLSGVISSDRTLYKSCSPYTVSNNLLIKEGASLVIEPGVVIEVSPGKFIRVEGNIRAVGNSNEYITFESNKSTKAWNDWKGIEIRPTSISSIDNNLDYVSGSQFKYVKLKHTELGIYVYNTGVHISNSEFSNNYKAIEIRNTDGVVIDNSIFSDNHIGIWSEYESQGQDYTGDIKNTYIKNSIFSSNTNGIDLIMNQRDFINLNITNNVIKENNIGIDFGGGGYGPKVHSVLINENIIYNNTSYGVNLNQVYGQGTGTSADYPLEFTENVVINNAGGALFISSSSSVKYKIHKNLLITNVADLNCITLNHRSPAHLISQNSIISKGKNIYIEGSSSYHPNDLNFTYNLFGNSSNNEIIDIKYGSGHIFNNNNFNNPSSSGYFLKNQTSNSINAENNYWGTSTESEIQDAIYDYNDNFDLGEVDYTPFATSLNVNAPISPPKNVKIIKLQGSAEISFDANTESDLKGYKLHYGEFNGYSYASILDLGNTTDTTISGIDVGTNPAITAYDNNADGSDDQVEGHESWFSEISLISAPVGVNDSYQIAKGGELDLINGPFAHYQFDGDIKDVSGNGYDLINTINAPYGTVPDEYFQNDRFDKEKKALKFSGGSTIIEYPHNDAFNFKDQNEWSIYFWVKFDKRELNISSSYQNGILSKFSNGDQGWGFKNLNFNDFISPMNPVYRNYSTIQFNWLAGNTIANGEIYLNHNFNNELTEDEWNAYTPKWQQVVVTYDGSEAIMYIDGSKVDSDLGSLPDISSYNWNTKFGESETANSRLLGHMDDIRFYNRALTTLEIQDMYTETNVQSFAGVLANDTDLDGDALTATLVQTTTNGTLTFNSDGKFKYVPNAGFSGNDVFTYKATDGTYSSANTTVNISVSTPPTAADDSYSVDEEAVLTVDAASGLLSNDTDAESDAMTALKLTGPSHGTLTLNSDGSFTYDHDGGGSTSDSFTYQASDGIGNSNTATVTITIVASDDAPVANPDAYGTEQDEALSITKEEGVLKNDSDEEGDAMTVELVTDVTLGSLSLSADGSFDYTPPTGQKGIDTFYYKVKAAEQYSNTTYATININGRPVIASNQTFSVDENKPNGYTVGQISIVDESSSFTWDILSGNTNNIFSIDANGYIKVNDNDSLNYERITEVLLSVRAHDGSMWSESKDITININNVNDMSIISYNVTPSYCSNSEGTGAITLEIEGEEGNVTVSWSNGANTLSIENLASGTYSVTITDAIGQTINESYEIQLLPIYDQVEVCFITADFNDYTRNRIYVKVGSNPYNIDKYLIYREGVQANVYEKIGEIDPSLAQEAFVDTDVDNRNSSYRYKVRVQDKCGNLSPLSEFQETIHLSSNAGIDGRINLQWTPYRGLEFSTYEIYRSINNEDFDLLTQTSSNSLAYSDVSVDQTNQYRYFVAILAEVTCAPSGEAFNGDPDTPTFGIDLNNPTGLKGKKIVRPRGNQEIIEATDDDGDGVINDEDQCPDTPDGETVDSNGCSDSQKDTDGDGVSDDKDTCANTPSGESVDADGCSDSQKDTDGDGVTDDKDDCPNTPLGELVFLNGCSLSQLDDDGDGVTNGDDLCPNTPSGETADANGCSDSQVDTDEDGVTDDKDTCANTPSGETVDANGCSDSQKDTDGDGVTDDKDNCPNTPNGENVDSSGCPAPLFVEKLTFVENVFPNPTDDILTVSLKDNLDINEIYFIDFSGKIIKPKRVDRGLNVLRINVSNLREGIFILNITTDSEVNKAKVFIER